MRYNNLVLKEKEAVLKYGNTYFGDGFMKERQEVIDFCLEFPHSFEDYPFDDLNWTVMRRRDTKKGFAWIFERENKIWVNVKVKPDWAIFWRDNYKSVIPAYHMNKTHWNSIIHDGSIPDSEIKMMISESFELCGKRKVKKE